MSIAVGVTTRIAIEKDKDHEYYMRKFYGTFARKDWTYNMSEHHSPSGKTYTMIYIDGSFGKEVQEWMRSLRPDAKPASRSESTLTSLTKSMSR
jgi:hypothetical protein